MPNVNYYNRTAPFWDWVASMEEQGRNHPMFGARGEDSNEENNNNNNEWPNFWSQGVPAMPGAFFMGPGRGGFGHPRGGRGPVPEREQQQNTTTTEKDGEAGPSQTENLEQSEDKENTGSGSQRGRGFGPGGYTRCARGGGWGRGRGRGGPMHMGGGFFGNPNLGHGGFGELANQFQEALFGGAPKREESEDFKPEVDVFDTSEAFVVHVSLPGAKKEDVGVNWDAEKSELSIAGVVYRPGDEEFLQTLVMNERKVGAFERKVRLGSRANPAAVDVDGIHARMEDGVLLVEIPKLDSGYVEVKKVDIE